MSTNEDDFESSSNDTEHRSRSPSSVASTTRSPPYFIPRRPRVVKMRDLSPDTRDRLTREYFDAYDPWTGIRIAATLGILISLFTLFLIYKSRFTKSKNAILPSKKTSLYLYDEDLAIDPDLGSSLGSSDDPSSYAGFQFYKADDRFPFQQGNFNFREGFQLEEVLVKSSMVECVALKVHQPPPGVKKPSKGGVEPKFGTLCITEDASRSLPCSPYKLPPQNTDVKTPHSPVYSTGPASLTGSITSFGSTDTGDSAMNTSGKVYCKSGIELETKNVQKTSRKMSLGDTESKTCPKSLVVTAKKPQDYRSRSTVVAIARRKRPS
ncbi:uncharacterized protein LOC129223282 [Uloborus diversus]|uniref:uncharacterized protein LOC129223282 n=1 Tax=Uloborus diversus TaxID=327109 RepID=UPI00240A8D95|nr:uncharacterized protein LOC129223282 [Uloborus diversus]